MLCGAETLQQHGEESDSRWEGGGRHGSGGDEEEDGATASCERQRGGTRVTELPTRDRGQRKERRSCQKRLRQS
jgi:hypothetical protein